MRKSEPDKNKSLLIASGLSKGRNQDNVLVKSNPCLCNVTQPKEDEGNPQKLIVSLESTENVDEQQPSFHETTTGSCGSSRSFYTISDNGNSSVKSPVQSGSPHYPHHSSTTKEDYSITYLIKDWESLTNNDILPHWRVVQSNFALTFVYLGDNNVTARRSILVKNDMTVVIFAEGRPVKYQLLEQVTCFKDLYSALKTIVCLSVCEGIDAKSKCPDGFFIREPHSNSRRCQECQKKRKRDRNIQRKRNKGTTMKTESNGKLIQNLKRQHRRSSEKFDEQQPSFHEATTRNCGPLRPYTISDNENSSVKSPVQSDSPHYAHHSSTNEDYSLTSLIKDWESSTINDIFPHWGIVQTKFSLSFVYLREINMTVTRSILVKNDMTVEIFAEGRPVKYQLLERVTCFKDLYFALKAIVCLNICEGSDEKSKCPNGFFIRKPHSNSGRCQDCQKKRKRDRDIQRKREERTAMKTES